MVDGKITELWIKDDSADCDGVDSTVSSSVEAIARIFGGSVRIPTNTTTSNDVK